MKKFKGKILFFPAQVTIERQRVLWTLGMRSGQEYTEELYITKRGCAPEQGDFSDPEEIKLT